MYMICLVDPVQNNVLFSWKISHKSSFQAEWSRFDHMWTTSTRHFHLHEWIQNPSNCSIHTPTSPQTISYTYSLIHFLLPLLLHSGRITNALPHAGQQLLWWWIFFLTILYNLFSLLFFLRQWRIYFHWSASFRALNIGAGPALQHAFFHANSQ